VHCLVTYLLLASYIDAYYFYYHVVVVVVIIIIITVIVIIIIINYTELQSSELHNIK